MPGNAFGEIYSITTFGERHGKALGVIIDGVPAGMQIRESDIQMELDRRRPGQSRVTTPRKERDRAEIVFRETAARVAGGAVAKKNLKEQGIYVYAYSLEIAGVRAEKRDIDEIESNIVRAPDSENAERMIQKIEEARNKGDSVDGIVEVVVMGCPPGLEDPVFDKLDALLSHAVMSIGAVKAIEIESGIEASRMSGKSFNDTFCYEEGRVRTRTNNAGGILGGISTGEDIVLRAAR